MMYYGAANPLAGKLDEPLYFSGEAISGCLRVRFRLSGQTAIRPH